MDQQLEDRVDSRRREGSVIKARSKSRSLGLALGLVCWSVLVWPHEARPLFDRAFGGVPDAGEMQLRVGRVASIELQIIESRPHMSPVYLWHRQWSAAESNLVL